MDDKLYTIASVIAAIEAGTAILEVYHSADFEVEKKADASPLTLADRRAHEVIMRHLSQFEIPILSEEGKNIPYDERKGWEAFWLVDPLDGTKEFIKKNGEFTVNIARIAGNKPVAGVVFVPDRNILYFASSQIGSYRVDLNQIGDVLKRKLETDDLHLDLPEAEAADILSELIGRSTNLPINLSSEMSRSDPCLQGFHRDASTNQPYTIAGSRSHSTPELEAFVEEKRQEYGEVEFISAGSSLKLCLVAEGRADIYPRTGPTMEWDTGAGQAIVECSGGKVYKYDTTEPLEYNKEDLLNPWFVVLR